MIVDLTEKEINLMLTVLHEFVGEGMLEDEEIPIYEDIVEKLTQ